jgi:hypothetical protein
MNTTPARKKRFHLLAFVVVALLPSCASVKYPLVEAEKAKPDYRLYGVWKPINHEVGYKDYAYLFIGGSGDAVQPSGIMKGILIGNDNKNHLSETTLHFFGTQLGQANYAHVIPHFAPGALTWDRSTSRYLFFKYAVEKDRLTIWKLDYDSTVKAIDSGKLQGTLHKTATRPMRAGEVKRTIRTSDEAEITESPAGLSKFLTEGGDKLLFPHVNPQVLIRVN